MYLIRIVLPLSKAILAVMALYYGVGQWNAYFNAMIYLTDAEPVSYTHLDAGLFVALNGYEEYRPNYVALLEKEEGLRDLVYFSDGTGGGLAQQANYATTETSVMPTNVVMIYQPWFCLLYTSRCV